jgi:hypothetical protein
MATGVSAGLWTMEDVVAAIDERTAKADIGEMVVG